MASEVETLQAERERLENERAIATLKSEIRALEGEAVADTLVMEAWGDLIDPKEYLRDDPQFGKFFAPIANIDDRMDGRYRPIFETEQELSMIRGATRVICDTFGSAKNISNNLDHYTIGEGFTHEVGPAKGFEQECPPLLCQMAQRVLDDFFDKNDWKGNLETELHRESRKEGEGLLKLKPKGWHTEATILDSEQLTEPANGWELEDWLGCRDSFVSSWSFGVHTRRSDASRPLGYNIIHDSSGLDWEYLPADDVRLAMRMGTGLLEMIKRNVPRKVKRGITDFYPIINRIENVEKLGINVEKGSAIQAAIAFIREHNPTSSPDDVARLRAQAATERTTRQTALGPRTVNIQKWAPGTIVDTNGSKYIYGPTGQSSAPNFIEVIQSGLRYCGCVWNIPEYMLTSDASNNNFASILVAGSPFVKAREADQRFYVGVSERIDWKVLRIAYEAGFFQRFNISWEQLEMMLQITITPPDITIADELKDAQVKQIERQNRVLSADTWIAETGRDPEVENKKLAAEDKQQAAQQQQQQGGGFNRFGGRPGQPGQQPGQGQQPDGDPSRVPGEYQDANRIQFKRLQTNVEEILTKVAAGTMTPVRATEFLGTLGLPPDRVQRLLADIMDDGKLTAENARSIAEDAAMLAVGMMLLEDDGGGEALKKKLAQLLEDCGHDSGGFSEGNDCAKGGGGGVATASAKGSGRATSAKASRGGKIVSREQSAALLNRLKSDGGFTYDAVSDKSPTKGFVVSTSLENERIFTKDQISEESIQAYIDEHAGVLDDPTAHVGGWFNEKTGEFYLDVSRVIDSEGEAIELAKANKQEAIYGIESGKTIFVNQGDALRKATSVPVSAGDDGQGDRGKNETDGAGNGGPGQGSGGAAESGGRGSADRGQLQSARGGVAHPKDAGDVDRFVRDVEATAKFKDLQGKLATLQQRAPAQGLDYLSKVENSDADGNYTPERAKIHDDIIDGMLNPKAAAKAGQKPVVVLTLGPPGAGKSTIMKGEAKRFGVEFTTVNPDDVKQRLPGYEGWNGASFHEESTDVSNGKLMKRALEARHNIVYDSTGSKADKMAKIVQGFAAAGYDVHVVNVAVPPHQAIGRAWDRFAANDKGRYVPLEYVKNVGDKPSKTYSELKKLPGLKGWTSIDNSGSSPKEVDRGER